MLTAKHGIPELDSGKPGMFPEEGEPGCNEQARPRSIPRMKTSEPFLDEDDKVSVDEPRYDPPSTPTRVRRGLMKTFFKNHVQADFTMEEAQQAAEFSRSLNSLPSVSEERHASTEGDSDTKDCFDESTSSVRSSSSAPAYMRNISVAAAAATSSVEPELNGKFEHDVKMVVSDALEDQSEGPRFWHGSDSRSSVRGAWKAGKQISTGDVKPRRASGSSTEKRRSKNKGRNRANGHAAAVSRSWHGDDNEEVGGDWGIGSSKLDPSKPPLTPRKQNRKSKTPALKLLHRRTVSASSEEDELDRSYQSSSSDPPPGSPLSSTKSWSPASRRKSLPFVRSRTFEA